MDIPAYCSHCKLIFPSGIVANNVHKLKLTGNRSQCPRCHNIGNVIDGTFNIESDVISVVQAPWATFEVLSELARLLGRAQQTNKTPAETASEAEKLNPSLARLIQSAAQKIGSRKNWANILLLMLIFSIRSCSFNFNLDANVNVNELVSQMVRVLQVGNDNPRKK